MNSKIQGHLEKLNTWMRNEAIFQKNSTSIDLNSENIIQTDTIYDHFAINTDMLFKH